MKNSCNLPKIHDLILLLVVLFVLKQKEKLKRWYVRSIDQWSLIMNLKMNKSLKQIVMHVLNNERSQAVNDKLSKLLVEEQKVLFPFNRLELVRYISRS